MFIILAFLCEIDPHPKNDISCYIWHRSFIQTAKCSLLDKEIIYQSFYGALHMFSYFLTEEKFCVLARIGETCVTIICRRPCRKNYISGYIWHRSFIQTVKCSFSNQKHIYQSFCGSLLTFKLFFTSRKSSVFRQSRRQLVCDLRDVYCLNRASDISRGRGAANFN